MGHPSAGIRDPEMHQRLYPDKQVPWYIEDTRDVSPVPQGYNPIMDAAMGTQLPQPTQQQIEDLASGRITNAELFDQLNPPPAPTPPPRPQMDRLSGQPVRIQGYTAPQRPRPQMGQPQGQGVRPQNNYRLMPPPPLQQPAPQTPLQQPAPQITPPGALPGGVPYRPEFIPQDIL